MSIQSDSLSISHAPFEPSIFLPDRDSLIDVLSTVAESQGVAVSFDQLLAAIRVGWHGDNQFLSSLDCLWPMFQALGFEAKVCKGTRTDLSRAEMPVLVPTKFGGLMVIGDITLDSQFHSALVLTHDGVGPHRIYLYEFDRLFKGEWIEFSYLLKNHSELEISSRSPSQWRSIKTHLRAVCRRVVFFLLRFIFSLLSLNRSFFYRAGLLLSILFLSLIVIELSRRLL